MTTKTNLWLLIAAICLSIVAILFVMIELIVTIDLRTRKGLISSLVLLLISVVIQFILVGMMFAPYKVGYYTPIVLSGMVNILQGVALGVMLTTWFANEPSSGLWFASNLLTGISLSVSLAFTINHIVPGGDEVVQDKFVKVDNEYQEEIQPKPASSVLITTDQTISNPYAVSANRRRKVS